MSKIRIGIVRGGPSREYGLSLKTGGHMREVLSRNYNPIDILVTKDGTWHIDGVPVTYEDVSRRVDVVFNALHGAYGEDGRFSHTMEMFGLPYTGSSALACATSFNKALARDILEKSGIRMPRARIARRDDDLSALSRDIFETFMFPVVIKPASGGSSIGIATVGGFYELEPALRAAAEEYDAVLIEEFVKGTEATCGVVENFRGEGVYALPVAEFHRPQGSFACPAGLDKKTKETLMDLAQRVHVLLGLRHYSRSDFIVTKRGIYVLEVNALPALGEDSPFMQELESIGSNTKEFAEHIVTLALERK